MMDELPSFISEWKRLTEKRDLDDFLKEQRLIPFSTNSPTGSTFTAFPTFVSTRGLIKICPGFASSHSREALDTVPMAA
jgi:hypothetical protein